MKHSKLPCTYVERANDSRRQMTDDVDVQNLLTRLPR